MTVRLKCSTCEQKFSWDFAEQSRWPKACPLCGEPQGAERPDDEICLPAFISAKTTQNDALYRQMETASENRVHAAAEAAGCDVSEMAGLKMTDLKTGVKEGEIYAPALPANPVSDMMARGVGGFQSGEGFKDGVRVSSSPRVNDANMGARTHAGLQRMFGK